MMKNILPTFRIITLNSIKSFSNNTMIRNRFVSLMQQKKRRGLSKNTNGQINQFSSQVLPLWQHQYYHFKSELADIQKTNGDISKLIDQFNITPTVYNMRILERLLDNNCKLITKIEEWVNRFPFSQEPPSLKILQRNLVKHFQSSVIKHINIIFLHRQRINALNQQLNSRSVLLNNSNSYISQAYNDSRYDRGLSIKEISSQIESLNSILRRMGDIVANQGDILNRIDENLNDGLGNVKMGRQKLSQRQRRQQGQDQFSCQGKVNKVIMSLYIIDVILIFILVFKNL